MGNSLEKYILFSNFCCSKIDKLRVTGSNGKAVLYKLKVKRRAVTSYPPKEPFDYVPITQHLNRNYDSIYYVLFPLPNLGSWVPEALLLIWANSGSRFL